MSILERVVGLSKPRSRKQILACLLLPALLSPASAQELPANQDLPAPAQAAPAAAAVPAADSRTVAAVGSADCAVSGFTGGADPGRIHISRAGRRGRPMGASAS